MKRKILFISHSSEKSGAPRVLLDVAESLSEKEYDLTFCLPEDRGIAHEIRNKGYNLIFCYNPQKGLRDKTGLGSLMTLIINKLKFMKNIRAIIAKGSFDLVYINSIASLFAGIALIGKGNKILWHLHEDLKPCRINRLKCWLVTKISDKILFVSPSNLSCFPKSLKTIPHEILPNGIDIQSMESFSPDKQYRTRFEYKETDNIIATLSYISHRKGIDVFLKALPLVFEDYENAKAVIPGDKSGADPKYLEKIEEIQKAPELKNHVFFPGFCSNIPSFLDCVNVFVLPSRNDPMPLAVLEAMAMRKAIVATDVGSLKQMIDPPHAGIIVPPEDPPALAKAILNLLKNPSLRHKMGNAAKQRIQRHYSRQIFQKRIIEIISNILENR